MKNIRIELFSFLIEDDSSPDELIVVKLIQEVRSFHHLQYSFLLDLDRLEIPLNNIDIPLEKVRNQRNHLHQKNQQNELPLRIFLSLEEEKKSSFNS